MGDYDVIVIGGGFSGAVMAERFANLQNKRVLVIEQRAHIAGNCFDYVNEAGILVHHYGPHLFHTNKSAVWDYLSQFTEWTPYEHKVLAAVDSKLVPIPFNLNTLEMMFSHDEAEALKQCLIATYGFDSKVPILELRQSPDAKLRELAECVYEKFFVNYTTKQWGCSPEQISPSVTARVPVVISRDDRYFQDRYQAIPKEGYTKLVAKILAHPNITVTLNTDATSLIKLDVQSRTITFKGQPFNGTLVFTGMLDQLFAYCHGELPYR